MSPIQRDGIHAYILLPREFKRQCRSSRLKAIQSLFFPPTHSEPSNSKTQMCTIIYEAVALPILLRCCAPCPWTFFFPRSGKARLQHCFFSVEKFEDIVCLTWLCRWWCTAKPCSFEGLSGWAELLGSLGFWHIFDSLVREPAARYLALQNKKAFARTNCPLLFQLQRLNAFVPSKTDSQWNGTL